MAFKMPRVSTLILVFLLPLAFGEEVTELANDDAIYSMAIVFLVLCIIALVIALVVPMMLYRRLESQNTSSMGSKYKMSQQRKTTYKGGEEIGFYGAYTAPEQPGSIYLPLNKITTNGSMPLSTYATLQKPDGTYEEVGEKITNEGEYATLKKDGKDAPASYDNPRAYEDMNGDTEKPDDFPDDYEYVGDTIEFKGPTKKREGEAAYDNPVIKADSNVDTAM